MKPDPAARAGLCAVLRHDIESIGRLSEELRTSVAALKADPREFRNCAAAAYLLHNLYNALENSFEQVSRTFENHVVDRGRWHRELLDKMFLPIDGWRPAVLPEGHRGLANDLRGFRHIFRHSYDFTLDPGRVIQLAERWLGDVRAFEEALERFCEFLIGDAPKPP
ncbi:MAG: antitoxin [Verrucomicrobiae bacterium]|nr:antitoxin [Verrucomicrobiae bacterium]